MTSRTADNDRSVLKGILAAITGFGLFAIGDALGKWLTRDYPVTELLLFNGLFGLLFLLAISPFFDGIKPVFRTRRLKLHLLRAVIIVCQCFMVIYAFSNLPMANVYAFVFAAPLIITALSAPLLGQRVGVKEWIGVLSGFTGILVMLRPGMQPLDLPILAALGTALFFSIGSMMVRVINNSSPDHRFCYSSWPMLLMIRAGIISCMVSGFDMPNGWDLLLFIASGATSCMGMVFMAVAFNTAPAATVAPFHYTQMLWGVGLGYFIWSDLPDLWTITGSFMVIASGLYVIRSQTRKNQPVPVVVRK